MPKGKMLFRKTDVRRAFEAAEEAGVKVSVEIDKAGKLRLVPLSDSVSTAPNPWDAAGQSE
jgi:hypothetical protein